MAGDPIRLFHFSDIHFGLEDRQALSWVAQCIVDERPDAVAITGDLTMRARHREFAAACEWIKALDVPVTVEIGNHDMPYFNPVERFLDPYRRFRDIESLVERELDFEDFAVVPLKTTARAQWRLNWSKGCVTRPALAATLSAIDALPASTRVIVAAHHPLVEVGTDGTALTKRGEQTLEQLARRNVRAVLTGHVHDPFDLVRETRFGSIRMIGAGTLSCRIRSTPASFNEMIIDGDGIAVTVRNREGIATSDMQIGGVPQDAMPPREPGEPVAPVRRIPDEDPPVH